jgi:hypothetical protein
MPADQSGSGAAVTKPAVAAQRVRSRRSIAAASNSANASGVQATILPLGDGEVLGDLDGVRAVDGLVDLKRVLAVVPVGSHRRRMGGPAASGKNASPASMRCPPASKTSKRVATRDDS